MCCTECRTSTHTATGRTSADPARPVGADNPPGLGRNRTESVVRSPYGDALPLAPADLATGCFVLRDEIAGAGERAGRITHAALKKYTGRVHPETGKATEPTTPRGMVGDNFAAAVAGAIEETRRQWRISGSELTSRYGPEDATLMICALTGDDPIDDCRRPGRVGLVVGVLGGGVVLAGVAVTLLRRRRRRRGRGGDGTPGSPGPGEARRHRVGSS